MTHCPLLKSPRDILSLILILLIPTFAVSEPTGSTPTIQPGALSVGLSTNSFVSLNGTFYLSDTRSSSVPVAQTYPQTDTTSIYATSPLSLRLSPSLTVLFDSWVKLIRFDVEYTVRTNLQTTGNSTEQNRPIPLRRHAEYDHELTEAYATVLGSHVGLEAGRVRPLFGLGIAANPGTFDHTSNDINEWGQSPQHGDIVDRVRAVYATQGLGVSDNGLSVSAGYEHVARDDRLDSSRGDSGEGFFMGVQFDYAGQSMALGAVQRSIDYQEGGYSDILNVASTFSASTTMSQGYTIALSGEFNVLTGSSTLPESIFIDGPFDVFAHGGVLRAQVEKAAHRLRLEGGWASGDEDRYDNVQSTFQFDPNYRVGLVLFPMINATYARIAIENAGDPNFRARLPRGAERTLTSGSIENTVYLNPTWTHHLNQDTLLSMGFIQAWRATPYFDLFRSNLNGGEATDPLGNVSNQSLGQEVNCGLARVLTHSDLKLKAFLVGGVAWSSVQRPGESSPVYASSARLEASW